MSESKNNSKPFAPGYNHTDYNSAQMERDPCYHESQLSLKCLSDNGYDRTKCGHYFENYKTCKTFWMNVRAKRFKHGVTPALPPLEERPAMKKLFQQTGEVPLTPQG